MIFIVFQRKHPDRPTKPLTSFMLFFLDKKEKIQRENPGANGVGAFLIILL